MILNILTTATPRVELHIKSLEPWLKALHNSKIFDKINWFVNLDKPDIFNTEQMSFARNYLHAKYKFLNLFYTECVEDCSFTNAARTVYNNCYDNIESAEKNYFMWLEDDWKIKPGYHAIDDIKKFIESGKEILSFGNIARITGWPHIVSENMFYRTREELNSKKIDPELAMMLSSYDVYNLPRKYFPRDYLPEEVIYRSVENRCFDMGVRWRDSKQISKTYRYDVNQNTWKKEMNDLLTPEYKTLLETEHKKRKWGNTAPKYLDKIVRLAERTNNNIILDYGSGHGSLRKALEKEYKDKYTVIEYEPGIEGKQYNNIPCNFVVCVDVLEHIEPHLIDNVLFDLKRCVLRTAFFTITTRPAYAKLPDGRNAHLIVESAEWWEEKISKYFTITHKKYSRLGDPILVVTNFD